MLYGGIAPTLILSGGCEGGLPYVPTNMLNFSKIRKKIWWGILFFVYLLMTKKEIKSLRYYRRLNRASRKRHGSMGIIYMENEKWGWTLPANSEYCVIIKEELQKIV